MSYLSAVQVDLDGLKEEVIAQRKVLSAMLERRKRSSSKNSEDVV